MTQQSGDNFMTSLATQIEASRLKNLATVAAARAAAPDKEPFDIEVFGRYYSLRGQSTGIMLTSADVVAEYERDYYLRDPTIMTLQDFAERQRWFDSYDCG